MHKLLNTIYYFKIFVECFRKVCLKKLKKAFK